MADPMFGVPKGRVTVDNPDGVFQGSPRDHSLYDNRIQEPVIPGDFDICRDVPEGPTDAGRLHPGTT